MLLPYYYSIWIRHLVKSQLPVEEKTSLGYRKFVIYQNKKGKYCSSKHPALCYSLGYPCSYKISMLRWIIVIVWNTTTILYKIDIKINCKVTLLVLIFCWWRINLNMLDINIIFYVQKRFPLPHLWVNWNEYGYK